MKTYRGVEVLLPPFMTSTLGMGEWSPSRLGHFNTGGIVLGTYLIVVLIEFLMASV
jgi:hypothetical protein